jgi:hypothetical protein
VQRDITSGGEAGRFSPKIDLFQSVSQAIEEAQDLFKPPFWFIDEDSENYRRDITKGRLL